MSSDQGPSAYLGVRTVLDPTDETYKVSIEVDDVGRVLHHHAAIAYAVHVYAVAERAEYDAAVYKQITGPLDLSPSEAGQALLHIRNERRPLNPVTTAPLLFLHGFSLFTSEPFVTLQLNGRPGSQMTPAAAREHAMFVLKAVARAHDETIYRRFLINQVGADENVATNAVAALDDDTTESKED